MIVNKNAADQYLIANQFGLEAGKQLASSQQSSSKKPAPETLNRHLEETSKFYKKDKFTQVSDKKETSAGEDTKGENEEKTKEKKFLLEGVTDIYGALPKPDPSQAKYGPVYPSIHKKLFPALDTMENTVEELGKHPTPEEVDRSNIRRLIRSFQPVAEAFEGSYDKADFNKAMKRIQNVASSLGKYKDVSVIETELKAISPDGTISPKIQKKLDEHREKEAEKFQETYRDFRKHDMEKALKVLRNPEPPKSSNPLKVEEKDKEIIRANVDDLVDNLDAVGLQNKDPHTFHEGRKALRKLLNSLDAAGTSYRFNKNDMEKMKGLVNLYGQAQDKYIAYEWLDKNGFKKEADTMLTVYNDYQKKALEEGAKFTQAGILAKEL